MAINNLHVIILGAGSSGLLIAQGLKKNGIQYSVYERESEYEYTHHQRDWSMAMLWGSEDIKTTLPIELLDRFDEIKADPFSSVSTSLPFYDGKTGELVVNIPGGVAIRVSREKLRKFLYSDVDVKFGKISTKIEELGDKVVVTFNDGSTATADTVVCCDGIKGLGRSTLLGAEKSALSTAPCTIVNITNKYTAEQAQFIRNTLDPVCKFAGHPDQPTLFLITPVDIPSLDHPEEWKLQCLMTTWGATHSESSAERLRVFKEAAANYAEPWRSAALWLPDDAYIPSDQVRYWADPVTWPNWNGKLTLAGDAAHPMMPFRAQGLNNAMADGNQYVATLVAIRDGQKTLADGITAYGNEVLERGAKEIKLSAAWGPMLHNWDMLMNAPMMKQGYGKPKPTAEPATQITEAPKIQNALSTNENIESTEASETVAVPAPLSQPEETTETSKSQDALSNNENVDSVKASETLAVPAPPSQPEETIADPLVISTNTVIPPQVNLSDPIENAAMLQGGRDLPTPSLTPTDDKKMSIPDPIETNTISSSPEVQEALKALQLEIEVLKKRNEVLESRLKMIGDICMGTQVS